MNTTLQTQPDLTVRDVATQCSCSLATIYRAVSKGALKGYRLAGTVGPLRFTPESIHAFRNPEAN